MFKSKMKQSSDGDGAISKTVTTETIETEGGVTKTTRSTITTGSSRGDIEAAFKNFDIDRSHTTNIITKRVIHTTGSGENNVTEEITETYNDVEDSKPQNEKPSKNLAEKLGLKPKPKESTVKTKSNETVPSCMKACKFEEDCLKSHNAYRKKHGVPSLKLSKELCVYAKEWADHLAERDSFQHRSQRKYGENIYMKWSSDPSHVVEGHDAVDSWYSEIKDHVFGKEPTSLKSGHFTQVIWKDSTEVGVAWAKSKGGKVLVVANYNPAGNFVGKFAINVPPPKK